MGGISPGVAGAATEHPLEGVAEDPTWVGHMGNAHSMSGRDYKGGSGLKRGGFFPLAPNPYSWRQWRQFAAPRSCPSELGRDSRLATLPQ